MKWYVIWMGWLIRSLFPYILLAGLFTIVSSVQLSPRLSGTSYTNKAVFASVHWTLVLTFYLVYSLQASTFILIASQLFTSCKHFEWEIDFFVVVD